MWRFPAWFIMKRTTNDSIHPSVNGKEFSNEIRTESKPFETKLWRHRKSLIDSRIMIAQFQGLTIQCLLWRPFVIYERWEGLESSCCSNIFWPEFVKSWCLSEETYDIQANQRTNLSLIGVRMYAVWSSPLYNASNSRFPRRYIWNASNRRGDDVKSHHGW